MKSSLQVNESMYINLLMEDSLFWWDQWHICVLSELSFDCVMIESSITLSTDLKTFCYWIEKKIHVQNLLAINYVGGQPTLRNDSLVLEAHIVIIINVCSRHLTGRWQNHKNELLFSCDSWWLFSVFILSLPSLILML